MDLGLATKLVTQYYNLYAAAQLEESKAEKLRTFANAVIDLKQAAQPPAQPMPAQGAQAVPEARPTSPMLPNAPLAS
jgi:hypothetical protein